MQVDVDIDRVLLVVELGHRLAVAPVAAAVAEQDVDPAEILNKLLERRLDRFAVAQVDMVILRLAALGLDLRHTLGAGLVVNIPDGDLGAGGGHELCRRAADHAGSARNQGDAVFEVRRHMLVRLVVAVYAFKNLLERVVRSVAFYFHSQNLLRNS